MRYLILTAAVMILPSLASAQGLFQPYRPTTHYSGTISAFGRTTVYSDNLGNTGTSMQLGPYTVTDFNLRAPIPYVPPAYPVYRPQTTMNPWQFRQQYYGYPAYQPYYWQQNYWWRSW